METVPENFGVLSLTQRCTLKTLRIASQRTAPLNRQLLIDSLETD